MGISYVGDCEFAEIPGSTWSVNAFDLDVFNVTLKGRSDKLTNYLQTLQKHALLVPGTWSTFAQSTKEPLLYLREWRPNWGGAFSTVAMEFVGEADSRGRRALFTADTKEQTVNLHEVKNGTQTVVSYKAQTMTCRYFAKEFPKGPQVANKLLKSDEGWNITNRTGNTTDIIVMNGAHGLANSSTFYARKVCVGTLHFEQVGPYFMCTETNEGRLVDHAFDTPLIQSSIEYITP